MSKRHIPCDNAGDCTVRPADAEKGSEVFYTRRDIGDVDRKAYKTHQEPSQNKWPSNFQFVRIVTEGVEYDRCIMDYSEIKKSTW